MEWEDEVVEVWTSVPPPGSTNPFEWPRGRWNEIHFIIAQWTRKLKKVHAKKNSSNQINQFHKKKIFFYPNSIFSYFKNGQKSIFELGKSLKLPKNDFTIFFCLDFLNFCGLLCLNY